jgi:phosphohistidine phosphatase
MLVSPAVRAQQTAQELAREATTCEQVNVGADASQLLEVAGWPNGSGTVVVVGHQPTLGAAAALALTGKASQWRVRKSGGWWLSRRGESKPFVVAVLTPQLI